MLVTKRKVANQSGHIGENVANELAEMVVGSAIGEFGQADDEEKGENNNKKYI